VVDRFDIERLRAALYGIGQPPAGPGWNRSQLVDLLPDSEHLSPAAVLVGIVEREVPTVLLTRRTDSLATHAGQISFPGGRIDPGDIDAIAAALREADEEVGLGADFVSPLGYLDPFETISAYRVLPVVALVRPGFVLRPNPDEVAEAFEAPLSLFFDHSAHRVQHIEYRGLHREIHEFEFAGHRIWGATAAMLVNLRDRLEQIR